MDELDRNILTLLGADARMSVATLARRCNLCPPMPRKRNPRALWCQRASPPGRSEEATCMRGKCWVCSRQARGLGHTDNRHPVGNPKRYPLDWVFCSRRCQDAFHKMYGNWVDAQRFNQEVEMIDASDV